MRLPCCITLLLQQGWQSLHLTSMKIPSIMKRSTLFLPAVNSRLSYSSHGSATSCLLPSRGVVRLSGSDTPGFLQGLVTNDLNQLIEKSPNVQYCMMLNVQGRVLYDLFLYNITEDPATAYTILVDVDVTVKEDIIKTFRKYKLRKKIDISDVSDEFKVCAQWGQASPSNKNNQARTDYLSFHDPRVSLFGNRIISSNSLYSSCVEESAYKIHRYQWGIPEGVSDLPPGNCLPLESNLSLMNGVNFHKGCYIGQELTARTHHTGVTRKRLMSFVLSSDISINQDSIITTVKGRNAGKFRSAEGKLGLGLLRMAHLKDSLSVTGQDGNIISLTPVVPSWWPQSALATS